MADIHDHDQDEDCGRGAIDCNGNWYPLMPTLEEQNRARDRAVNNLWDKYQRGMYKKAADGPAPRSKVEYMDDKYLHVSKVYHAFTDAIINIDVSSKDPDLSPNLNFISYNPKDRCLAFRGQACNYGSFYSLAQLLLLQDRIDHFFKARSEVRFPDEGLQPDLDYQVFAGRVEIVEYAAWLKESSGDSQSAETMALLNFFRDNSPVYEPPTLSPEYEQNEAPAPATISNERHVEPSGAHDDCSAFDAAISTMKDAENYNSDGYINNEGEQLTASTTLPFDMNSNSNNLETIYEEQHGHGTTSLEQIENHVYNNSIVRDNEQHNVSHPSLMDVDNDQSHDVASAMSESLDVPMVGLSISKTSSPWSLFGECDDQELMTTIESTIESPISSPLTVIDVEAIDRLSPVIPEEEPSSPKCDSEVSEKKIQQEESDAALAARLAAQTPDRYSLRRHTRSASVAELEWLETSRSAKRAASSAGDNPVSPSKKRTPKKGMARKKKPARR